MVRFVVKVRVKFEVRTRIRLRVKVLDEVRKSLFLKDVQGKG